MEIQIINQEEFTTKFNNLLSIGQEFEVGTTKSSVFIRTKFATYHMRVC